VVKINVADLARHCPWRRAWSGGQLLWSIMPRCPRRLPCACSRGGRRRPPQVSGTLGTPLGPNSESESEPAEEACEADRIAYTEDGKVKVLSGGPCRDVARGEPVTLLHEDAEISDIANFEEHGGGKAFRACHHHAGTYEMQRALRKCAKEDCMGEATQIKDGVRLCTNHARSKQVQWKPRSRTPSPSRLELLETRAASDPRRASLWIAWVRDPTAPASQGWDAYYRYPGRLEGEAADSTELEARHEAVIPDLGLRFSIPEGCLEEPARGSAEFLATRPPVVLRWSKAPEGDWIH